MCAAQAETLKAEINKIVPDKDSIIITDSHNSYISIGKEYAAHEVVNHSIDEYVNDAGFTTNNIESAFAILQRGIYGIYHHVSEKHLQRYCHEFAYRFNNRKIKDFERFNVTMENKHLKGRLTYKTLIAKKS